MKEISEGDLGIFKFSFLDFTKSINNNTELIIPHNNQWYPLLSIGKGFEGIGKNPIEAIKAKYIIDIILNRINYVKYKNKKSLSKERLNFSNKSD